MITINDSRRLAYFDYTPLADKAIKNFLIAKTVRVFKGKVFVKQVSLPFFIELLRNEGAVIKIITKL